MIQLELGGADAHRRDGREGAVKAGVEGQDRVGQRCDVQIDEGSGCGGEPDQTERFGRVDRGDAEVGGRSEVDGRVERLGERRLPFQAPAPVVPDGADASLGVDARVDRCSSAS